MMMLKMKKSHSSRMTCKFRKPTGKTLSKEENPTSYTVKMIAQMMSFKFNHREKKSQKEPIVQLFTLPDCYSANIHSP